MQIADIELWIIIEFFLALGIGMGVGSWSTMPYYRLPREEPCAGKWVGKKSHCVHCGVQLRTRDLVPIFNWLGTRGKCFNCGKPVNPVYFFIELGCTLVSLWVWSVYGLADQFYILTLGLGACLVILCATEYSYRKMPDQVLVVMVMLGFLYRALTDGQIYDMVVSFTLMVLLCFAYARWWEKMRGIEFP